MSLAEKINKVLESGEQDLQIICEIGSLVNEQLKFDHRQAKIAEAIANSELCQEPSKDYAAAAKDWRLA